jgi:hypothetical protein
MADYVLDSYVLDRFDASVDRSAPGDACWPWLGPLQPNGYGRFCHKGVVYLAHRLAWVIEFGPVPGRLYVLHKCDNKPCARYDHLELGTHSKNVRDAIDRGLLHHASGEQHPFARLSDATVAAIRTRHATGGITYVELAREFQISESHASRLVRGIHRAHPRLASSIDAVSAKP